MKKSIHVYTNDPKNEKIALQLSGMVKKFVTIQPSKVFLRGNIGDPLSQTVSIIPGEGEEIKILQVNALKGGDFKYHLAEQEIDGRNGFILTVENVRETEGRYFDKIFMITDRTDQAPLSIIVSGYLTRPQGTEGTEGTETEGQPSETAPETEPAPADN